VTHNYRICFDYAAESPRDAVIYLQGLILDPQSQDTPFDWLVIDLDTGQIDRIRCTFNELDKDAAAKVKQFLQELGPAPPQGSKNV
jgi:hypothetical protein